MVGINEAKTEADARWFSEHIFVPMDKKVLICYGCMGYEVVDKQSVIQGVGVVAPPNKWIDEAVILKSPEITFYQRPDGTDKESATSQPMSD
jgi:hypothetical protein